MFSSSLFTPILVSLQRGLTPIFHNQGHQIIDDYDNIRTHSLYQFILNNGIKSVKMINKCIFKCICVFYTFSTRLLKTQCNMWNKVIQMPVEMWKTKYQLVVEILCGKLLEMPCKLDALNAHFCSDVREQSITLSPINVNTSVYIL